MKYKNSIISSTASEFFSDSLRKIGDSFSSSLIKRESSLLSSMGMSFLHALNVIKFELPCDISNPDINNLLELIDPENYHKHSRKVFTDRSVSQKVRDNVQLYPDTQYLSILPEHTFIFVDNTNPLTFYFLGKKAQILADYVCSYLTDTRSLIDSDFISNMTKQASTRITVRNLYYDIDDKELYSTNASFVQVKPMDKIFTSESNKKLLTTYAAKWEKASELFRSLGVTYKLGILLYGKPGTGKTTLIKALAAILNYDLYVVDIASFPQSPPDFSDFTNSIILFEDIDYAFSDNFNSVEDKARANALLQALDGVASASNVIFAATTNDINSLSDALLRDGRFDLKISMEELNDKQEAVNMCKSLNLNEEEAEKIVSDMTLPINQAMLQNKCIQYIFNNVEDWSLGEDTDEWEDEDNEDDDFFI